MEDIQESDFDEPSPKKLRKSKRVETNTKPNDQLSKSKYKHKLDSINASELLSPLKRLKIEPRTPIVQSQCSNSNTKDSSIKSDEYFIQACKDALSKEFNDIGRRLGITILPECCLDKAQCNKIHQKKVTSLSELSYEPFRIDMQAGMWIEALNVCRSALKYNKYPSIKMMQSIMKIILNLHEDKLQSYSLPFVLQKCQNTFKHFLSTHPPCMSIIRKTYLNFLISPMKWDCMFQNQDDLYDGCGLFEFILNRLEIELSNDSPDGPITDLLEFDSKNLSMKLTEAYILKNQYETYLNLPRKDRIVRLFMVLDLIVNLLEKDLSIWVSRYPLNLRKFMMGQHKPLIAFIIWHQNDLLTGTVNQECRNIFQLLINVIKLEYPSHTINAVARLFNLVSFCFYSCDENITGVYPNIGKYCTSFGENMFAIIKDENIDIILEVATNVKIKYMKYILTSTALKHIMKSEDEFLNLVLKIFEKSSWESFPMSNLKSSRNSKYSDFTSILESLFVNAPDKSLIQNNYRKSVVYKHLVDGFEDCSGNNMYNIEDIRVLYRQNINKDEICEKSVLNPIFVMNDRIYDLRLDFNEVFPSADDNHFNSFLSQTCIGHYQNIFKHLKKIGIVYSQVKLKTPWINNFFQNINFI